MYFPSVERVQNFPFFAQYLTTAFKAKFPHSPTLHYASTYVSPTRCACIIKYGAVQKFFRDSALLLDNFIMQSQFFISEFRNGIILGPGKLSTFRDSICDRFTKFHFGLSSAVSLSFTYVALSKDRFLP